MSLIQIMALIVALAAPAFASDPSATQAIDPEKSVITIRVFKAGLFSAFGHDHEISAPIASGSFSQEPPAVSITVNSREMKVMDRDISEKDRAEIQQTMLSPKVLDAEKYPEITFKSREIDPQGEHKWAIQGDLTVRGETRPVKAIVTESAGHYRGMAEVRQKEFGITPVSAAGGAVKTKDELRVEFNVVGK